MAKRIILKRDEITDRQYFRDADQKKSYRRIYGGIGWPSGNANGCAVILAEDLYRDYEAGTRILNIIATEYDSDAHGLLDRMDVLQDSICRVDWYGNTDSAWMRILPDKNREIFKLRKSSISIFKPPAFDSQNRFGVYSQMLKSRTGGGVKSFYFNNSGTVREFQQLNGNPSQIDEDSFPGVAAVLYALAAMDFRRAAE